MCVYNKYSSVERVKESRERAIGKKRENVTENPRSFFDLFAFSRHLCRMGGVSTCGKIQSKRKHCL